MADTDVKIAQQTLEAGGLTERQVPIPRIIGMIPPALSALSFSVGQHPDRRHRQLLRRTFATVAISGGTGNLIPLLQAAKPPILELNSGWEVTADDVTGLVQNLPDSTAGNNDKPPEFAYFWLTGTTINVVNGDGTPYDGNIYITGNFQAEIADLYGELNDNLIRLLLERIGVPTPPEPAEAEARR